MASLRRLRPALVGVLGFAALAAGAEEATQPQNQTQTQTQKQNQQNQTQSALTLSLSPAGTPVTFTRKEENVAIAFTVSSSGNAETPGVRLQVTPFIDDQGRPAEEVGLLVNGRPPDPKGFAVPAFGRVPVRIEARLPRPGGTYTAHLILIQGDQVKAPVALTVQRPAAAVTLRDIPAMRAKGGSVSIPLTLQETSGQTVKVKVPEVVGLTRDTGEQLKLGADADWKVVESPSSKTPLTKPFPLQGLHTLGLRISGLGSPGKYEGTVVVPYGEQTVEKALTVYVRWPWWLALALIAAGVVISWLLRKYLTEERPRLVERRRGELILEELEGSLPPGDLEPGEQALVVSLRGQIGRQLHRLEAEADLAEVKAALLLLETKASVVAPWILLGRQVRKLEPPELRAKPQGKLDGVERALLDPGANAEILTAATQTLQNLPAEIEAQVLEHLKTRFSRLDTQVRTTAEAASTSVATLLPIQLNPPLERARVALADNRLEEAALALDEGWKAFAWILAGEIDRELAGARPAVLTEDEWKDLRERANAALAPARQTDADPERAVAAVRTAQSIYLDGLGTPLMRRIETQLRAIAEDDDTQKTFREELKRLRDDLEQGLTWMAEEKLDKAGRQIAKVNKDLLAALQVKGIQLGDARTLKEAWVPAQAPDLLDRLRFSLAGLPAANLLPAGAPSAEERIRTGDLRANLVIIAIASALGVPALWAADPSWGGFQDSLTAALWGLGLHQFSYTGVKGLFDKLSA
jgi:hypothetical protein